MTKKLFDTNPAHQARRTDAAPDPALEGDLIRMLGRMEQLLVRLAEPGVQRRPSLALEALLALVDQVVAFAGRRVDREAHGPALNQLLASARDLYDSADALRGQLSDSVVVSLFNLFGKEPVRETRRAELYRRVVAASEALMREAFALLTVCLPEAARADWEQAHTVFLDEFTRVAETLRF
jgi:hypothetical protein